ncbi:MAG: AI-2E family transporter [Spirochaetia bacterium]
MIEANRINSVFLGILTIIAIGTVMDLAGRVLQPLVVAVLLSYILAWPIAFLVKLRFPRILAILTVLLFLLGVLFLIGLFLYTSVNSFIYELPDYQQRFNQLFEDIVQQFEFLPDNFFTEIDWMTTLRVYLVSWSSSFVNIMTSAALLGLYLVFLLLEKPYMRDKIEHAFQKVSKKDIGAIFNHINVQISKYLTIKLLVSLLTGILVYITTLSFGVDFPLIWGTLSFFLNFIPNIGSIFAVFIVTLYTFIQFYPVVNPIIWVGILTTAINLIIGNFLEPRVHGAGLNLSPFFVLFSLLFWGWLWGAVGMIISVPVMVAIKIICENIEILTPVSIIMGTTLDEHSDNEQRKELS